MSADKTTPTNDPSPYELWKQAGEDPNKYRRLLVEHGHLVAGEPEPLPCGWMPKRKGEPQ